MHGRLVLFVCTGNVFRSLTAEHALRMALAHRADVQVASAGTDDYPHLVMPEVATHLARRSLDVSAHRRRTLTQPILDGAQLVVAMGTDHREFIRAQFGRGVPLFLECCGEGAEGVLDLHEAVSDFLSNRAAAVAYLERTIDRIIELTPRLAGRIDSLIPCPPSRSTSRPAPSAS